MTIIMIHIHDDRNYYIHDIHHDWSQRSVIPARKVETSSTMKVSKETSARHRAALLEAASRLFRERGFEGVSIADIAAEAGLTHGAFYTHFASKDALCAEVVDRGIGESEAMAKAVPNRRRVEFYLSAGHAADRAKGCAIAALSGDVARESPEVRAAFSRSIDHLFDVLTSEQPAGTRRPRDPGIVSLATRIGALVLARATTDPKLRNEILSAAKRALLGPASR